MKTIMGERKKNKRKKNMAKEQPTIEAKIKSEKSAHHMAVRATSTFGKSELQLLAKLVPLNLLNLLNLSRPRKRAKKSAVLLLKSLQRPSKLRNSYARQQVRSHHMRLWTGL
mmetsp:Transcript_56327/g.123071  ORF Transcript_56327/g.123071 Transcript_56327/m.123071 type:complete len:112 (+) Transcript_56327:147-482(+)